MEDYEKTYEEFWKNLVENPDGTLNKDAIMRELFDFSFVMENVTKVYCEITNNRISKANTYAEEIIREYWNTVEGHMQLWKDDILQMIGEGETISYEELKKFLDNY